MQEYFCALKCKDKKEMVVERKSKQKRRENRGLGCGKREDNKRVEPSVLESSITKHRRAEFSRQYHLSKNHRG